MLTLLPHKLLTLTPFQLRAQIFQLTLELGLHVANLRRLIVQIRLQIARFRSELLVLLPESPQFFQLLLLLLVLILLESDLRGVIASLSGISKVILGGRPLEKVINTASRLEFLLLENLLSHLLLDLGGLELLFFELPHKIIVFLLHQSLVKP